MNKIARPISQPILADKLKRVIVCFDLQRSRSPNPWRPYLMEGAQIAHERYARRHPQGEIEEE